MSDPSSKGGSSGGASAVDPLTAFWRDVWARAGAAGPGMGVPGMPGMMPGPDASAFMTPEAVRRMQGAFLEAMAQYAEQYLRTPEFLESMKRSMEQAVQFRQQMDDFLKSNMATAFESATGGASSEILGAIRHSNQQIQAQIARIEERLSELETAVTGKPAAGASKKKSTKR